MNIWETALSNGVRCPRRARNPRVVASRTYAVAVPTPVDPYQSARLRLGALAAQYSTSSRNEDTTRIQLIDALLFECLGHPRRSVTTEVHAHPGFADYIISTPGRLMVIEAKKEAVTFELPTGLTDSPVVALATLRSDPAAAAAIDQVSAYAQSLGIPFAAIANGPQLAVFLGSRADGVAVADGQALVFRSFDDMLARFRTFWDYLGHDGLAQRRITQVLNMSATHPQPPPKLAESITSYPGFRPRSARETDLKILSAIFIQDIEGNASITDEFLEECYYNSGTLSQYALISKEILRARYGSLEENLGIEAEPVRNKRGVNPTFKHDLITAAVSSKPIVLLGDVGVGKTMFIRHLFRIEAVKELGNALVLYVDFGREPALQDDLEQHVTNAVVTQLRDSYDVDIFEDKFVRAAYNGELNRFGRGIYGRLAESNPPEFEKRQIDELARLTGDVASHVERSLKHLDSTGKRKSILVLDNIDQRSKEFQDRVFVIAQALSSSLDSTVFVSLRPSTFYESKLRGSLAAYQPRAFHVSPPKVSEVVARRLAFAKKKLSTQDFTSNGLSIGVDDLQAYLDALTVGFTKNEELIALLENLSGGNVRVALEYLATFIGSGYVDTARVLKVAEEGDIYTIPPHEFIRSIIFGENNLYDPSTSRIVNVFDIYVSDEREHFLLLLLLAFVQAEGDAAGGSGYVNAENAYQQGQIWGFLPEQIRFHLDRAVDRALLTTDAGNEDAGPYRITSVGAYMYKKMVSLFSYVDAMSVDTPILDPTARSRILDVWSIDDRLKRAEELKLYLDEIWAQFPTPESLRFDWNVQGGQLQTDIDRARLKAERARARR